MEKICKIRENSSPPRHSVLTHFSIKINQKLIRRLTNTLIQGISFFVLQLEKKNRLNPHYSGRDGRKIWNPLKL
jgi:hypothetical protein